MEKFCYKCSKSSKEVLYMVDTGSFCICSEDIKELDKIIQDILNSKGQIFNEKVTINQKFECSFCEQDKNIININFGKKNICNDCIRILYETCIDSNFDIDYFKKCLKNLDKLEKIYYSHYPLDPNEKINNVFQRAGLIITKTKAQIEIKKEWFKRLICVVGILCLSNIKNMMNLSGIVCVFDTVFIIFGLFVGYSIVEYLKLKILGTTHKDRKEIIRSNAFLGLCMVTLLIVLFLILNYFLETLPQLAQVNNDNHLSKLHILPIIVLSYSFIINLRLYLTPEYLFNLINRNLKTDYLQNFGLLLIVVSTILWILSKIMTSI